MWPKPTRRQSCLSKRALSLLDSFMQALLGPSWPEARFAVHTQGGSPVRDLHPPGSVRGGAG